MKNTTFRKKALLSSVCMLLVALVALGSATFAWFTASTSASASGVNVKTVQASELKVASSAYSFTDTLNYGFTDLAFKPASSSTGSAWFTGEAADKSSFATDGTYSSITLTADDHYVFDEELNIRNYGAAAVNNVTVTFSIAETATTEGANYVRVALVPISAHNGACTAENFQASVFDKDGVVYDAVSATNAAAVKITPKTEYSVTVGNLAGSDGSAFDSTNEKNYKLFIWFEGQDTDCKDANAGNALPTISFSISGETAN